MCVLKVILLLTLSTVAVRGNDNDRDDVVSFLVVGDWGKGGESGSAGSIVNRGGLRRHNHLRVRASNEKQTNQVAVAAAMANYASTFPQDFVVTVGDNFYTKGVSSYSDSLWTTLWTNIYLRYSSLQIPWFAVLGNHDYGYGAKGVRAQQERQSLHLSDDLWHMPATNYSHRFCSSSSSSLSTATATTTTVEVEVCAVAVDIVFIDTTTLAPSQNSCCDSRGGVSAEVQAARIQDQLTRIDHMLTHANNNNNNNNEDSNNAHWLVVVGHYPIVSFGEHGDTSELFSLLLPLLSKHNVHAYFSGHDHISEHLTYNNNNNNNNNNNAEFFVVGAGCMVDYLGKSVQSEGTLMWAGVGYSAFAAVTATATTMTVSFVDTTGAVKYSRALTNPSYFNNNNNSNETDTASEEPSGAPTEISNQQPATTATTTTTPLVDLNSAVSDSYISYILREYPYSIVVVGIVAGVAVSCLLSWCLRCREEAKKTNELMFVAVAGLSPPRRLTKPVRPFVSSSNNNNNNGVRDDEPNAPYPILLMNKDADDEYYNSHHHIYQQQQQQQQQQHRKRAASSPM